MSNYNLRYHLKDCTMRHINYVLIKYQWDKVRAAKALGIGLSTLYRKIDELKIITPRRKKRR